MLAERHRPRLLAPVWLADDQTPVLRGLLARRDQLVRQRCQAKNEIHAGLHRSPPDVAQATAGEDFAWLSITARTRVATTSASEGAKARRPLGAAHRFAERMPLRAVDNARLFAS